MPSGDYVYKFSGEHAEKEYSDFISEFDGLTIAGMDEVGRGGLFGEVVVACVVLNKQHGVEGITDSKKISLKKRTLLEKEICDNAYVGIGVASSEEVDELNIFRATHVAALRAFNECSDKVDIDLLLCDGGLDIRDKIDVDAKSIIKGDLWNESIGAASIVAKVYRDTLMDVYHELWPEYGLNKHRGYGTKYHRDAIEKYGITSMHRRTFGICKTAENRNDKEDGQVA